MMTGHRQKDNMTLKEVPAVEGGGGGKITGTQKKKEDRWGKIQRVGRAN